MPSNIPMLGDIKAVYDLFKRKPWATGLEVLSLIDDGTLAREQEAVGQRGDLYGQVPPSPFLWKLHGIKQSPFSDLNVNPEFQEKPEGYVAPNEIPYAQDADRLLLEFAAKKAKEAEGVEKETAEAYKKGFRYDEKAVQEHADQIAKEFLASGKLESQRGMKKLPEVAYKTVQDIRQEDFTNDPRYNTQLTPEDEQNFQEWMTHIQKSYGRNPLEELAVYDLRGYWKNTPPEEAERWARGEAHAPDTWKKPSHETFSNESIYSTKERPGGTWAGDKFVPSPNIERLVAERPGAEDISRMKAVEQEALNAQEFPIGEQMDKPIGTVRRGAAEAALDATTQIPLQYLAGRSFGLLEPLLKYTTGLDVPKPTTALGGVVGGISHLGGMVKGQFKASHKITEYLSRKGNLFGKVPKTWPGSVAQNAAKSAFTLGNAMAMSDWRDIEDGPFANLVKRGETWLEGAKTGAIFFGAEFAAFKTKFPFVADKLVKGMQALLRGAAVTVALEGPTAATKLPKTPDEWLTRAYEVGLNIWFTRRGIDFQRYKMDSAYRYNMDIAAEKEITSQAKKETKEAEELFRKDFPQAAKGFLVWPGEGEVGEEAEGIRSRLGNLAEKYAPYKPQPAPEIGEPETPLPPQAGPSSEDVRYQESLERGTALSPEPERPGVEDTLLRGRERLPREEGKYVEKPTIPIEETGKVPIERGLPEPERFERVPPPESNDHELSLAEWARKPENRDRSRADHESAVRKAWADGRYVPPGNLQRYGLKPRVLRRADDEYTKRRAEDLYETLLGQIESGDLNMTPEEARRMVEDWKPETPAKTVPEREEISADTKLPTEETPEELPEIKNFQDWYNQFRLAFRNLTDKEATNSASTMHAWALAWEKINKKKPGDYYREKMKGVLFGGEPSVDALLSRSAADAVTRRFGDEAAGRAAEEALADMVQSGMVAKGNVYNKNRFTGKERVKENFASIMAYYMKEYPDDYKQAMVDTIAYTRSLKRKPGTIAMRLNAKTLFSLDFSSNCPMRKLGRPCLMCYIEPARVREELGQKQPQAGAVVYDFAPLGDAILNMPPETVKYLNEVQGGLRVFSLGDYEKIVKVKDPKTGEVKEYNIEAEIDKAVAQAKKVGLKIKMITKQLDAVRRYGNEPNVSINLSVDFDPEMISGIVPDTFENRKLLALLSSEGRQIVANTLSVDQASNFIKDYKNTNLRYVVNFGREEAIRAIADPRISIITMYHGNKGEKLLETWLNGLPKERIRELGGPETLERLANIFKPKGASYGPLTDFINAKGAVKITQAELDAVFGPNKITVQEFLRRARQKTCCQTGKCGTCFAGVGAKPPMDTTLFQREARPGEEGRETEILGSVEFDPVTEKALIRAFKNHDVGTAIHEFAHVWERGLRGKDREIAEAALGVQNGVWTRDDREKFARAAIMYFRDGRTNVPRMLPAFNNLKDWMIRIYGTAKQDPNTFPISKELRKGFDAWFGGGPEAEPVGGYREPRRAAKKGPVGPLEPEKQAIVEPEAGELPPEKAPAPDLRKPAEVETEEGEPISLDELQGQLKYWNIVKNAAKAKGEPNPSADANIERLKAAIKGYGKAEEPLKEERRIPFALDRKELDAFKDENGNWHVYSKRGERIGTWNDPGPNLTKEQAIEGIAETFASRRNEYNDANKRKYYITHIEDFGKPNVRQLFSGTGAIERRKEFIKTWFGYNEKTGEINRDTKNLLRNIAKRSGDKGQRLLAKALLKSPHLGPEFRLIEQRAMGLSYIGEKGSRTIEINPFISPNDLPHVALHELVHNVTMRGIDYAPERLKSHAARLQKAAQEEWIRQYGTEDIPYGLKDGNDIYEFIAEAMTNPEFQDGLASMKYTGEGFAGGKAPSVWKAFVKWVSKLVGQFLPKEMMGNSSLLEQAVDVSIRLTQTDPLKKIAEMRGGEQLSLPAGEQGPSEMLYENREKRREEEKRPLATPEQIDYLEEVAPGEKEPRYLKILRDVYGRVPYPASPEAQLRNDLGPIWERLRERFRPGEDLEQSFRNFAETQKKNLFYRGEGGPGVKRPSGLSPVSAIPISEEQFAREEGIEIPRPKPEYEPPTEEMTEDFLAKERGEPIFKERDIESEEAEGNIDRANMMRSVNIFKELVPDQFQDELNDLIEPVPRGEGRMKEHRKNAFVREQVQDIYDSLMNKREVVANAIDFVDAIDKKMKADPSKPLHANPERAARLGVKYVTSKYILARSKGEGVDLSFLGLHKLPPYIKDAVNKMGKSMEEFLLKYDGEEGRRIVNRWSKAKTGLSDFKKLVEDKIRMPIWDEETTGLVKWLIDNDASVSKAAYKAEGMMTPWLRMEDENPEGFKRIAEALREEDSMRRRMDETELKSRFNLTPEEYEAHKGVRSGIHWMQKYEMAVHSWGLKKLFDRKMGKSSPEFQKAANDIVADITAKYPGYKTPLVDKAISGDHAKFLKENKIRIDELETERKKRSLTQEELGELFGRTYMGGRAEIGKHYKGNPGYLPHIREGRWAITILGNPLDAVADPALKQTKKGVVLLDESGMPEEKIECADFEMFDSKVEARQFAEKYKPGDIAIFEGRRFKITSVTDPNNPKDMTKSGIRPEGFMRAVTAFPIYQKILEEAGIKDEERESLKKVLDEEVLKYFAEGRFSRRKNIAGWEQDVAKNLEHFTSAFPHAVNRKYSLLEAQNIVDNMAEGKREYGKKLLDFWSGANQKAYQKEGAINQFARSFIYNWYLGFKPSFYFVNSVQPLQTSLPLAQSMVGFKKATAYLTKAGWKTARIGEEWLTAWEKDRTVSLTDITDKASYLSTAEKRAIRVMSERGELGAARMREIIGKTKFGRASAWFGSLSEKQNRIISTLMGVEIAKDKGIAGLDKIIELAKDFTHQSQFVYNKATRMEIARGVGAPALMFKSYFMNFWNLQNKLFKTDKKAFLTSMGLLLGTSGLKGIPVVGSLPLIVAALRAVGILDDEKTFKQHVADIQRDMEKNPYWNSLLHGATSLAHLSGDQMWGADIQLGLSPVQMFKTGKSLVKNLGTLKKGGELTEIAARALPSGAKHALRGVLMMLGKMPTDEYGRPRFTQGTIDQMPKEIRPWVEEYVADRPTAESIPMMEKILYTLGAPTKDVGEYQSRIFNAREVGQDIGEKKASINRQLGKLLAKNLDDWILEEVKNYSASDLEGNFDWLIENMTSEAARQKINSLKEKAGELGLDIGYSGVLYQFKQYLQ